MAMLSGWQANLIIFLRTFSEILTAGIAITAFSLLLYALAFNLRDRVARSFALIMIFVVVVFTAEAIGSQETTPRLLTFWLRLQWVGIVFLPPVYLHFSDALLATTGKPSRGRRRWAVRFTYIASSLFLLGLMSSLFLGPVAFNRPPSPHLRPTSLTDFFLVYYVSVMVVSWINFVRAYRRTTTTNSRRRMFYLTTGALAPALGAFPFLPYSSEFAAQHLMAFWFVSVLSNIVIGILLVVMAYSVAFFGVSWPDRVVRSRLFKWIMRGPFTASVTLGLVTLTRRAGEAFGSPYSAFVPIVMAGSILLCEYLITLFSPLGERWLFYGKDKSELDLLRNLENQLLTKNDLQQFMEMILATVCDRLQADGAYVAAFSPKGLELVVTTGKTRFKDSKSENEIPEEILQEVVSKDGVQPRFFTWGNDQLFPLINGTPEKPDLLGLLGVSGAVRDVADEEQVQAFEVLVERATLALQDRRVQQKVFRSLEDLTPQMDLIQRLRAAGQYDRQGALVAEELLPQESDLANWVKDALSHYWGGPKLTQNPMMKFKVVQDALSEHDGNDANALRAILKQAIERVRPEGERRFTAEWILYNILEMKFLEGRKVREVALRLAMSEADLYRKQRIAVEAVAKAISEMEVQARKGAGS